MDEPREGDSGSAERCVRRVLGTLASRSSSPAWPPMKRPSNGESAELIATYLSENGYDCSVALDGHQALALSREVEPEIALIDIGLPDMDGHALARALKDLPLRRLPKMIALSGYAQDRDRQNAREAGFVTHLAKPVDMATLTASLEAVLAELPSSAASRKAEDLGPVQ